MSEICKLVVMQFHLADIGQWLSAANDEMLVHCVCRLTFALPHDEGSEICSNPGGQRGRRTEFLPSTTWSPNTLIGCPDRIVVDGVVGSEMFVALHRS